MVEINIDGFLPDMILLTLCYYSGNPIKCHEVLSLQPMIPPKRFDIFSLSRGCSEGLGAFRLFKTLSVATVLKYTRFWPNTHRELPFLVIAFSFVATSSILRFVRAIVG